MLTNSLRQATSPEHFFALRLAQRLNDVAAVHHYIDLADHYSQAQLLTAYRRAKAKGSGSVLAPSFHAELRSVEKSNGNGASSGRLAAIRIERRAIAVVILSGDRLVYPPIARQLSSDSDKALGSAAMFINRIQSKCSFGKAAIEAPPEACEAQRSQLNKIVTEVLLQRQVAIWEIAKSEVLTAFGHPPLRFRKQVREVISAMWPEVNGEFGSPLIRDALALGLYCHVEHLLNFEN